MSLRGSNYTLDTSTGYKYCDYKSSDAYNKMTSSPPIVDVGTSTTDANVSSTDSENSNSTNEYDVYVDEILMLERYMPYIIPVFCGVIFVIGIIGNLLVVLVVSCYKQMRTRTNVLLLSLAVADLIYILVALPFLAIVAAYKFNWPFDPFFCKIRMYTVFVTFYASAYSLLGVSFNRSLGVVFPIWSLTFRTRINAIRTVLILWLIILLANIPILFVTEQTRFEWFGTNRTACYISISGDWVYGTRFVLGYAIPLALMCILYGLIVRHLLRGDVPNNSNSRVKKRAIRMCAVVVIVFAVCWLPYLGAMMWAAFGEPVVLEDIFAFHIFTYASGILANINSCVNPVIYAFLSVEFRSSLKKIIRCPIITILCKSCSRTPESSQVDSVNSMTERPSLSKPVSQLNISGGTATGISEQV